MKLQLIEGANTGGFYFKVTDTEKIIYVSYSNEANNGRTRDEALKLAQSIFSFWLQNGSPENVIKEIEFKEV